MKKVRVFCDSYTAALGIFWFIFGCPWSLFSIFAICSLYNRGQTEKEAVVMVVTMILPFIFLLSYFSLRLCDMVELDSEGIRLCSVFKKVEGISFQKYVNYEKLEAIKNLMEKEPVHLYEAAALFGYTDPNYVSRLFKKYYGYNITATNTFHF